MADEHDDRFGPIDFVVVDFGANQPAAGGFERLLAEVDRGAIRVLDLEVLRNEGGALKRVDPAELSDPVAAQFSGAASNLLGEDDLAMLGAEIAEGSTAVVLVYEELNILSVVEAWEAGGGRLVTDGYLTPEDVAAALDATEND